MKTSTLHHLHRRLGLAFCIFVLLASGSGIIHNVMSWTQPPPPKPIPSGRVDTSRVTIDPARAAAALGEDAARITQLALREISGAPWYQAFLAGEPVPRYVSATTGLVDPGADERFAAEIASRYLGGLPVRKTDYLTEFNREYIEIYRILPVYRYDADDDLGTRVYVSTMTGTVTRHTDNHRQLDANIFGLVHKYAFIRDKNLRNGILTLTTAGIFLTALAGVLLYFRRR
jgi:hypothetical protein